MRGNSGNRTRGEARHNSRLSDAEVAKIRRMYKPRILGYVALAREFGCSPWTVRDIIKFWSRT